LEKTVLRECVTRASKSIPAIELPEKSPGDVVETLMEELALLEHIDEDGGVTGKGGKRDDVRITRLPEEVHHFLSGQAGLSGKTTARENP